MTEALRSIHQEFPGDLAREHRQRKLRDPARVLRPFARADVGSRHAAHAGRVDRRRQFLDTRAQPALLVAEMQRHVAREFHLAVGEQLAAEIRHGAEHPREAENLRQQFVLEHAVLHRKRVVEIEVAERVQRGTGIDGLGGDDQRARLAQLFRIVDDGGARLDVRQPVEYQPLALQHARSFAAHDHRDFMTGARQVRTENGAERTRAEDGELHEPSLPLASSGTSRTRPGCYQPWR